MVAAARKSEVRYSHEMAYKVATLIATWMHPHVERCEIAGSLRRGRADVKDIELVLIPKASWLQYTDELLTRGDFTKRHAWGTRFRAGVHVRSGIPVDMFVADPGNWGWTLALRTGPGDVNERLMTWLKTNHAPIRSSEGYWWHGEHRLLTPTEQDVFDILGIPFVPPEQREIATYRVRLNDPARQWPGFSRWYEVAEATPIQQGGVVGDDGQDASVQEYGRFTPKQWHAMREYDGKFFLDFYTRKFESGELTVTEERIERAVFFSKGTAQQQRGETWAAQWRSSPQFRKGAMMLNLDVDRRLQLTIDDLVGERLAVLGISGSGKSNSTAVLIEETGDHIPFIIFDDENEYYTLREKFDCLVVGRTDESMLDVPVERAGQLARFAYAHRMSVILSLNKHRKDEKLDFLHEFFEAFWQTADSAERYQPYMIVLEECHRLIPQKGGDDLKNLFEMYASAGRKRGLSLVMSSQRSAKVDKDALTSARLYILHSVVHNVDMAVYKGLVPLMKPQEIEDTVTGLKPGEAIVIWKNKPQVVRIRQRTTAHPGATPTLDAPGEDEQRPLRALDEKVLDELRQALGTDRREPSASGQQAVHIADLEHQLKQMTRMRDEWQQKYADLVSQNEKNEQQRTDLVGAIETRILRHKKKEATYRQALEKIAVMVQAVLAEYVSQLPAEAHARLSEAATEGTNTLNAQEDPQPQAAPPDEPYRSPQAIKRAQSAQQRNFDRLRGIVRSQPKPSRVALDVLNDNPDRWLGLNDLGRLTGYSPNTFRLTPLVEARLLRRFSGQTARFQSNVDALLTDMCPDLDLDELAAQLVKV